MNKKKTNLLIYGLLFICIILTACMILYFYFVLYIDYQGYLLTWELIIAILLAIVFVGFLFIVFSFVIKIGYRKNIPTRISVIIIVLGISIPIWLGINEPVYNPGRNTIELITRSLDGNHTIDVEFNFDFESNLQDVGNISDMYQENFFDITFEIHGNTSIALYNVDLDQIHWFGIDERITVNNIYSEFSFRFYKSQMDFDIFSLHIDKALTKPNTRLFALSLVMQVDNSNTKSLITNMSDSIVLKNLYGRKINIESTNLNLVHVRDDYYISSPVEKSVANSDSTTIFYNIDFEISTRWTRFADEVSLIFLAIFIEPILEFRSIIVTLVKRRENSNKKEERLGYQRKKYAVFQE